MTRHISGLLWASQGERPQGLTKSKAQGSKALGLSYERKVGKALAKALDDPLLGPWYYFLDYYGKGYCQPDVVWLGPDYTLVFEVKLTDTPAALTQILKLYKPVLELVYGKPVRGVVVTKNLTKDTLPQTLTTNLDDALILAQGTIPVYHWLGLGSM